MVKSVPIELDRTRHLRYDVNAIADLETELGSGLSEIFDEKNVGISTIRAVLWAGLKWEDRSMTILKAGILMTEYLEVEGNTFEGLAEIVVSGLTTAKWLSNGDEVQDGDGKN